MASDTEPPLPNHDDPLLAIQFDLAYADLMRARREQREKDTPANRAAVAEAFDWIDKILDYHLNRTTPSSSRLNE
jgi:hypothetical protein